MQYKPTEIYTYTHCTLHMLTQNMYTYPYAYVQYICHVVRAVNSTVKNIRTSTAVKTQQLHILKT